MTTSSIISVILFIVMAFAVCECCYALGKIEGRRKGVKEGIDMCRKVLDDVRQADKELPNVDERE
jgi:hypothetical protein